jgi:hypothetical protein
MKALLIVNSSGFLRLCVFARNVSFELTQFKRTYPAQMQRAKNNFFITTRQIGSAVCSCVGRRRLASSDLDTEKENPIPSGNRKKEFQSAERTVSMLAPAPPPKWIKPAKWTLGAG